MIEITVDTRRATVTNRELLTSGSYGIGVQFTLSDDWAGLVKTACFRNGDDSETQIDIAMGSSVMCYLPTETCDEKYIDETVYAGIYGTDGNGNLIIPTIWVSIGALRQGVKPGYAEGPAPTPDMWAQIQAIAMSAGEENAEAAAQSAEAASGSADDAAASATEAAGYATAASESAEAASGYVEAAGSSASDAADSATAAAVSAGDASTAQTAAETAQTAAETAQSLAETAQAAAEAAQAFLENASATATTLEPGSSATASYEDGVFTFGIPKGDPGDPATNLVTSVNGETGAVVLDATDVGAYALPSGGIPKTDLASAVQTSLGKADTALQTAPVTSVNTQTGDVVLDAGDIAYEDTTVEDELGTINSALSSLSSVTEIIDTASGAIASFPDGAGFPMRSLLAQINPVQDLHGYDSPWAAGAGKNKLPLSPAETKNGITLAHNTDGSITLTGTATEITYFDFDTDFNSTLYAGYILSGYPSGYSGNTTSINFRICSASSRAAVQDYLSSGTGIIEDNGEHLRIALRVAGNYAIPSGGLVFKPMLRASTDSDTFQPYSNECPISGWTGLSGYKLNGNLFNGVFGTGETARVEIPTGTTAFTVTAESTSAKNLLMRFYDSTGTKVGSDVTLISGGTSRNIRSVTIPSGATLFSVYYQSGGSASEFSNVCVGIGDTISVSWQTEAGTVYGGNVDVVTGVLTVTDAIIDLGTLNYTYQSTYERFYATISNMKSYTMPRSVAFLCSCFEVISDKREIDQVPYGAIYNGSGININIKIQGITDATAFKNYVTGQTLVYPLAQPLVYHLSSQQIETLLGNNTVFVDTGSVSVTYQASIKGYIDKVLGQ